VFAVQSHRRALAKAMDAKVVAAAGGKRWVDRSLQPKAR